MRNLGISVKYAISLTLLLFVCCTHLTAQHITQKKPEKTRLLFLLDGSASMYGDWERTIKIRAARGILSELIDSLKVDPNVELALRIYGHNSPPEDRNCEDTNLEVPFGPRNHDSIIETIRNLEPKGTTPIAYSLEQAAGDFPLSSDYRNILIIITDGIESCGGDPCKVSLALQKQGIFLRPFVIGMNMDEDYKKQFDCVGQYFDTKRINDFQQSLNLALVQSLSETTVTVELLDHLNMPTETNVNVSFKNHLTGKSVYEFVHFRDKKGRTDTLDIEPVLTYDIIANTIPPVEMKNIEIIGGIHNEIRIKTPQGDLDIEMRDHMKYEEGLYALIKKPGTSEVIHIQNVPDVEKYIIGNYDVEVLTLPKTIFRNIRIDHKKQTVLNLADPGIINLVSPSFVYGAIYEIKENKEHWVINLDTKSTTTAMAMQPGDYKIAFRTKETFGSKFTEIKYFKVTSRMSTTIKLFNQ